MKHGSYTTLKAGDHVARDLDDIQPDGSSDGDAFGCSVDVYGLIGLLIVVVTIICTATLIWLKSGNIIEAVWGK